MVCKDSKIHTVVVHGNGKQVLCLNIGGYMALGSIVGPGCFDPSTIVLLRGACQGRTHRFLVATAYAWVSHRKILPLLLHICRAYLMFVLDVRRKNASELMSLVSVYIRNAQQC